MKEVDLDRLSIAAWAAHDHAVATDGRRMGAAVLSEGGHVFAGCAVEGPEGGRHLHAEVGALASMIAAGERRVRAILLTSGEKARPCPDCMDWILRFGGAETVIVLQEGRDGAFHLHEAGELARPHPAV